MAVRGEHGFVKLMKSLGTQCPLQSGGEGDTALSDGSQCGIGIRASDHVVVIITARIW